MGLIATSWVHAEAPKYLYEWPMGLPTYYEDDAHTQKGAILGSKLFFYRNLSRNKNVSCASCHKPSISMSDSVSLSAGTYGSTGLRNSPVIFNLYAGRALMHDGRAQNITMQVSMPLEAKVEMDIDISAAIYDLNHDEELLGLARCLGFERIDYDLVIHALSSYVASLVSAGSRFDSYLFGSDNRALTRSEIRGFELFRGKAKCTSCHKIDTTFATFSDNGFHNLGVGYIDGELSDNGRYGVTELLEDKGKFKTPTLRNISKTAPYMHDGSISTLKDVVTFYNEGGKKNPLLDRKIRPLSLSKENIEDLVFFLHALESPVYFYNKSSSNCVN